MPKLARCRLGVRVLAAIALLSTSAAASDFPAVPRAPELSAEDRRALLVGERVERPVRFTTAEGAYVGGVAYQMVRAEPAEVIALFEDVERLPEILPRTRSARLLQTTETGSRIAVTQGAGPFTASYALQIVRGSDREELKFWMDPSVPSDIRDVWGFFRAEPRGDGRTLVTLAVAVDLGPGLVRALFEDRVQALILRSVSRVHALVEPSRLAGGASP